jgi:hypothetical protein
MDASAWGALVMCVWPTWVDREWEYLLLGVIMREWQSPFGRWYQNVMPRWPRAQS